jgi:hypothetical protein
MGLSLEERKKKLMEECAACAAGGGASLVGDNGFEGAADPKGPHAGYDPLLTKTLKKLKKKDDKKVEEGYEPLPAGKMNSKIWIKGQRARSAKSFMKDYKNTGALDLVKLKKDKLSKAASQIKNMKSVLRNHDSLDSRFKEMENQDKGEKKEQEKQKAFDKL